MLGLVGGSGDKFRTSAGQFNYGAFSVGYNLMTGEEDSRTDSEGNVSTNYKGKGGHYYHYEKNVHRLGLVYFGFGPFKVGFNSETVRDLLQNKLIHQKFIANQIFHLNKEELNSWDVLNVRGNGKPYYADRFYWYIGSTGGSSLW